MYMADRLWCSKRMRDSLERQYAKKVDRQQQ